MAWNEHWSTSAPGRSPASAGSRACRVHRHIPNARRSSRSAPTCTAWTGRPGSAPADRVRRDLSGCSSARRRRDATTPSAHEPTSPTAAGGTRTPSTTRPVARSPSALGYTAPRATAWACGGSAARTRPSGRNRRCCREPRRPHQRAAAWHGASCSTRWPWSASARCSKGVYLPAFRREPLFAVYGLAVTIYLLSRFALSLHLPPVAATGELPSVAIVVPAMNEEAGIGPTIDAAFAVDYPSELLSVTSSTTAPRTAPGARSARPPRRHPHAARAALLAQPRQARGDGGRHPRLRRRRPLLRRLRLARSRRTRCARSCGRSPTRAWPSSRGHADVLNRGENLLTRLQQVRYYVAFRVVKAAESLFGAVTCASRLLLGLPPRAACSRCSRPGRTRRFLGREATFGDDRALTNMLLRSWPRRLPVDRRCETSCRRRCAASSSSRCAGRRAGRASPDRRRRFFWRKHPAPRRREYASIVFQLIGPLIAFRALICGPLSTAASPFMYLIGLYTMAVVYSLYYALAAPLAVLVGRHGVRRPLRRRADLADLLGDLTRAARSGARAPGRADDGAGLRIIGLIGTPGDGRHPDRRRRAPRWRRDDRAHSKRAVADAAVLRPRPAPALVGRSGSSPCRCRSRRSWPSSTTTGRAS